MPSMRIIKETPLESPNEAFPVQADSHIDKINKLKSGGQKGAFFPPIMNINKDKVP